MSLSLRSCLEDFRQKVNQHPRLRTLLKSWDRVIVVEGTDTGSRLSMPFSDSRITSVQDGEPPAGTAIRIRAPEPLLIQVFSGAVNPTTAFLQGELQVFADDRDQVKLDAITLVLWE
jgi:hypothetical protein